MKDIHQRNTHTENAVSDWRDDLQFIGDYILKHSN